MLLEEPKHTKRSLKENQCRDSFNFPFASGTPAATVYIDHPGKLKDSKSRNNTSSDGGSKADITSSVKLKG